MDPQHRLLLEHAAETLQHSSTNVAGSTAVMVGVASGDFMAIPSLLPVGNYTATGAQTSVAAGRQVAPGPDTAAPVERTENMSLQL